MQGMFLFVSYLQNNFLVSKSYLFRSPRTQIYSHWRDLLHWFEKLWISDRSFKITFPCFA